MIQTLLLTVAIATCADMFFFVCVLFSYGMDWHFIAGVAAEVVS